MTTYPIFTFLLDFFDMLLEWSNDLWFILTQPIKQLGDIPLWALLLSVGAITLVLIWLAKLFI